MNNKKFLEQLNLYLDGEIDPAGAAALEQQILSSPARRRIYNDYCRIHRATKLVCEQFRTAGAANEMDARHTARTITSGEHATDSLTLGGRTGGRAAPRPFRGLVFASGLAAACAVGVFIGTRAITLTPVTPQAEAPALAIVEPEPAAPAPVVAAAPAETAEPESFPAPFAPEARPDPFVQFAQTRGDPFALTPWTPAEAYERAAPATISNPPVLKVDPRFQPTGLGSNVEPAEQRESNPFRLRVSAQPVSTTPPSELSTQR